MQLRVLLPWLLVVGLPGGAGAQQRPPATTVTGVIVDATGAVLPNAQVDLTSAAGADGPVHGCRRERHVSIRSGGARTLRHPCRLRRVRADDWSTSPSATALLPPLRVTMPIAGISQAVTVGTTSAEVSRNAASNLDASTIDQKGIDNLPVFNQDVLATMSRFLDSSAIGTNGATLVVNGIEVNNLNFSASAIQQIKVNQDPFSAEYPRPGRGRIEVVLKPGSQEYHGTANVIFRDSRLDERNAYATVKPEEQRRIFEGFLSGPVRHSDKTSFMLSAKDNADDMQSIVVAEGVSGPINLNVPSPYRNVLLAGTLNHQRGDNTTISLTLSYQDQTMKNQGVGGVTLPSAGTNWSFTEESGTYTQQTIIRPTLLNQFRLFVGQEFEPTTSISADPKVVVLDAFTGGGAQADSLRTEHHFTLTDMLTWSRGTERPEGRHQHSGLEPSALRRQHQLRWNVLFLQPRRLCGRAAVFADPAGRQRPRRLPRKSRGPVRAGRDPARTRSCRRPSGLGTTGRTIFTTPTTSVRAGRVAFAPTEDGRTVIRAGVGVFYDRSGPRPIQDILRYDGVQQLRSTSSPIRRTRMPFVRSALERPAGEHRPAVAGHRHPVDAAVQRERGAPARQGHQCQRHLHRLARLRSVPLARHQRAAAAALCVATGSDARRGSRHRVGREDGGELRAVHPARPGDAASSTPRRSTR